MNEALNANMTKNKLSTKGGVKLINKIKIRTETRTDSNLISKN